MAENGWIHSQNKIILYLIGVAVLLILLGAGIYTYFGSTGVTVLDLSVSAVLTAALVILYFRQTSILESQRDLLTQEINREARQQHTETLRERVRTWHGNPDQETPEHLLEGPDLNIPSVHGASFESAPTGLYAAGPPSEDAPFQIIPDQLQGDRYLQDLLENHAPDLREKKEEIEELHDRFTSLRDEFEQEYEDGIVVEKQEYTLEPAEFLSRWVFDQVVLKERGRFDNFDELQERAFSQIERGETSLHPDEPRIWIQADIGGGRRYAVYSASIESYDRERMQDLRSPAQEDVEELMQQVLNNIDQESPYDLAQEAADVLDDAADALVELERILMEYEGRPIYPGDCKYLEEASIR